MTDKEYKWYAVYTKRQHEKKVYKDLKEQNVTVYLPLLESLRCWSDRKKTIQLPLFPNYLFVKICLKEYLRVLKHPSVISFVKLGKELNPIPEDQIFIIKQIVEQQIEFLLNKREYQKGHLVEIIDGPLKGIKGTVSYFTNKCYVSIALTQVQQTIHVKIDRDQVVSLEPHKAKKNQAVFVH